MCQVWSESFEQIFLDYIILFHRSRIINVWLIQFLSVTELVLSLCGYKEKQNLGLPCGDQRILLDYQAGRHSIPSIATQINYIKEKKKKRVRESRKQGQCYLVCSDKRYLMHFDLNVFNFPFI